jgi:large subunit ribosomal protein L6
MSRIGKAPIELPTGVEFKVDGSKVAVKGPKGQLEREIHPSVDVAVEGNVVKVVPKTDDVSNFWGLTRSLLNNMVVGVSQGFSKQLSLIGVGYRAQVKGKELHLTLGFSHPVVYPIADGLEMSVEKNTIVTVKGADKEAVGQAAANIRAFRKPEPYHGKGVRYIDERIITKVGKSAKK